MSLHVKLGHRDGCEILIDKFSSTDGRAAGVVVNALAWRTWCTVNVWGSIPARSNISVQLLKVIERFDYSISISVSISNIDNISAQLSPNTPKIKLLLRWKFH